jgi:hypothetical protein
VSSMIKRVLFFPCRLVYLTFFIFIIVSIIGCSQNQASPSPNSSFTEPPIPVNYHTYTDETSAYSISYPPDWEVAQTILEQINQTVKDTLNNLNSDLPVEKASFIFFAGLPVQGGYIPNVGIVIEPLPAGVENHDQLIEAEIAGLNAAISDLEELSRTKTRIDSMDASILEYTGTFPGAPKSHYLCMSLYEGRTAWTITCGSSLEDFDKWRGDFQSIVRSLRILKKTGG